MQIEYRQNAPLKTAEIAEVFQSSGIRRPSDDLARLKAMFVNANLTISAWHGDKLVGVCRALTDFSYCCYLSDLAVAKPYQQHGIGRTLISRVQACLGQEVAIILISAPEAVGYYPKLGFEQITHGFIIKRAQ